MTKLNWDRPPPKSSRGGGSMRGITPGGPFKAKYHGKCRACGGLYEPGTLIVGQGKGYGAIHASCAPTYSFKADA